MSIRQLVVGQDIYYLILFCMRAGGVYRVWYRKKFTLMIICEVWKFSIIVVDCLYFFQNLPLLISQKTNNCTISTYRGLFICLLSKISEGIFYLVKIAWCKMAEQFFNASNSRNIRIVLLWMTSEHTELLSTILIY